MRFPGLTQLRSPFLKPKADVARDAEELMQLWGNGAYDRATDLSWREDSGLVSSPGPGHWWSVRREVGRRLGHRVDDPTMEIAA